MESTKAAAVPDWVPTDAAHYLAHTEAGLPIRALARQAGCHASTVLRQIRRLENRRDDRLVDAALRDLGRSLVLASQVKRKKEGSKMNAQTLPEDEKTLRREAFKILRRMNEPGAVLAVAADMDKAVVVRETAGRDAATTVVAVALAQALALKGWIQGTTATGRIMRYVISPAGRSELGRLMAQTERLAMAQGMAEAPAGFDHGRARRFDDEDDDSACATRRRARYAPAESPVMVLSRRKDRNGAPFLEPALVAAAERLREDFELAQTGPRVTQNWDRFLTGLSGSTGRGGAGPGGDSTAARKRLGDALQHLGPGLGDVALRCCCYLEGLEAAEKRMGWSARSGKIVLRIALERLHDFYDRQGPASRMIG